MKIKQGADTTYYLTVLPKGNTTFDKLYFEGILSMVVWKDQAVSVLVLRSAIFETEQEAMDGLKTFLKIYIEKSESNRKADKGSKESESIHSD